uniref:WH2 domain-containing protein n=1 Tax=Panagrellus redivivus TaxID=6233 RepID=A0A7E4W229_PANRE
MLAPIVTKDMKLFNSRPIHTARIKNVRSRAQSLQDFPNANNNKQRVKIAPANQRNAQSVGNLSLPNLSRSPPKTSSMRKPLAAIAEGVEMPTSSSTANVNASLPPLPTANGSSKQHQPLEHPLVKPRSVALDDLRIIASKDFVDPTVSLTNSENTSLDGSNATSPVPGDKHSPSAGKRFINKLTSVFKSKANKNSIDNDDVPTSPNSSSRS